MSLCLSVAIINLELLTIPNLRLPVAPFYFGSVVLIKKKSSLLAGCSHRCRGRNSMVCKFYSLLWNPSRCMVRMFGYLWWWLRILNRCQVWLLYYAHLLSPSISYHFWFPRDTGNHLCSPTQSDAHHDLSWNQCVHICCLFWQKM